ncbi:MAG: 2-C-methyl-D-erythritol 4-phosphate cytidylyltransferase [Treponema sp.]|nr:2-C-methyl-D-erythritol 4-phosphate cytidylyltransferase [Treponema sp.]
MANNDELALILVAAGSSARIGFDKTGSKIKKEYLPMGGTSVLSNAAKAFLSTLTFSTVVVTYPSSENPEELKSNEEKSKAALFADDFVKSYKANFIFVPGGKTRQESVLDALEAISENSPDTSLVFIHDGARPFLKAETVELTYRAATEFGAAVPGLQPTETQKKIDENGFIVKHLVRSSLTAVQTPQVFKFQPILEAHRLASESSKTFTDDTEIWDEYAAKRKDSNGQPYSRVKVVLGDPENKKITYPKDINSLGN